MVPELPPTKSEEVKRASLFEATAVSSALEAQREESTHQFLAPCE